MKNHTNAFLRFYFATFLALVFCFQLNAQMTETIIRKLTDGTEISQRKYEKTILVAPADNNFAIDRENIGTQEFSAQKLEVLIRNTVLNQEEIVWSQEYKFPKGERAFHRFEILDVFQKRGKYYVLFFRGLELNVVTALKNGGAWITENETYLESTSESINPITEANFIGNDLKIIAKKGFEIGFVKYYEWKLKDGKWILTKEKEKNILPNFNRKA